MLGIPIMQFNQTAHLTAFPDGNREVLALLDLRTGFLYKLSVRCERSSSRSWIGEPLRNDIWRVHPRKIRSQEVC